jgi:uncharacterized membrane protein YeiH
MFINVIDHLGVLVFSISGLLVATNKKLDLFGGIIVAFITALGGGTIRDLLLNTEVAWMQSESHIAVVFIGCIIGYVFRDRLHKLRRTFFLFDTIGIGLFTIMGIQKSLENDQIQIVCLFMGLITATFGGVLRDVLCNEIPLLFRKEIYATACILGGMVYLSSLWLGMNDSTYLISFCILVVIGIRIAAVKFNWHIPLLQED